MLGVWNDLGASREGLSVEPGQYCTRAGTTEQFRVYAVDELIASDTRDFVWRARALGVTPHRLPPA